MLLKGREVNFCDFPSGREISWGKVLWFVFYFTENPNCNLTNFPLTILPTPHKVLNFPYHAMPLYSPRYLVVDPGLCRSSKISFGYIETLMDIHTDWCSCSLLQQYFTNENLTVRDAVPTSLLLTTALLTSSEVEAIRKWKNRSATRTCV